MVPKPYAHSAAAWLPNREATFMPAGTVTQSTPMTVRDRQMKKKFMCLSARKAYQKKHKKEEGEIVDTNRISKRIFKPDL